jgi:hypothetical protein
MKYSLPAPIAVLITLEVVITMQRASYPPVSSALVRNFK